MPFLLFLVYSADGQNTWVQKTSFSGAGRRAAVAFSIGSKGYMVTGGDGVTLYTELWEFNPSTNAWSQKTSFPGAGRWEATACSIGNKGYIGTGLSPSESKDWWEYDPATDSWSQKTDFSGSARAVACAGSVNGKGYLGTGDLGGFNLLNDFWEYDPAANSWTQKTNFGGTARHAVRSFTINDKLYFTTGHDNSDQLNDTWEFSPSLNSWSQKVSIPGPVREYGAAFSIGNKGYMGTGVNSGTNYKDFYEYDPQLNTWSQKADFGGSSRYADIGFSIGCKGYIGCGWNGSSYFNDFWEYTPDIFAIAYQTTSVSCNGGNDGIINLTVSGGNPPLTYSWSNGSVSEDVLNLSAGAYSVTITDMYGCTSNNAFIITQPSSISLSTIKTDADCGVSNGTANVNASGGIAPYVYLWNTGSTTTAITNIFAGIYSVTVTDSNGCYTSDIIFINSTPGFPITLDSINHNVCNAGSEGYLSVIANSSSVPLTYLWNNGSSNNYIDSLLAGNYTLTVTDTAGCVGLFISIITQPSELKSFMLSGDVQCDSNGYATVSVSGGTLPYSYYWNNGNSSSNNFQLTAGNYSVTITDANTCYHYDSATVNFNDAIDVTITGDFNICGNDSLVLVAYGAFNYVWSNGATDDTLIVFPAIENTYWVTGTKGICSDSDSIFVAVFPLPVADAGSDMTIFEGETITLTATGGPQYLWNTGETSPSISVAPLYSTLFLISVTDDNGCSDIDSVNIIVEKCGDIFVPNAFSPNSGGKDDILFVYGECISWIDFYVFDRWGELVFKSNDISKGWNGIFNGKPMDTGVFVYYLKYRNKFSGDESFLEGNIHLLK